MAKQRATPTSSAPAKPAKPKRAESATHLIANNSRAYHDYHVLEQYEAGVALLGTEVKSLRTGQCQLVSSYAKLDPFADEMWLLSVNIPEYRAAGPLFQHQPQRQRKLLLHRHEMSKIRIALNEKGTTLIPLKMYFKDGRAKVLI